MTEHTQADEEEQALLAFLAYQRASVRAIVADLDESAWHTPVVPSGWTVAGLVQHLGDAERHWFQGVVAASDEDFAWDERRPPYVRGAPFTCDRPSAEVLAYYREACDRSDQVIADRSMSTPPLGKHGDPELDDQVTSVRWVVLHLIEETASHSGHLEIARELLDGRTGLGLR